MIVTVYCHKAEYQGGPGDHPGDVGDFNFFDHLRIEGHGIMWWSRDQTRVRYPWRMLLP